MSIFFKSKSIIGDFLSNIGNMWNKPYNKKDENKKEKKFSSKPYFKSVKDYNM